MSAFKKRLKHFFEVSPAASNTPQESSAPETPETPVPVFSAPALKKNEVEDEYQYAELQDDHF